MDGLPLRRLRAREVGVSRELALVPRHLLGAGSTRATPGARRRPCCGSRIRAPGDARTAAHLPSNPSEWYRWQKDLRANPDIDILLAIDSTSFPLGTGPKLHEIWHSGYYPVAWTNRKYRMIYFNFGHNDIDYEHKYDTTNKTLSRAAAYAHSSRTLHISQRGAEVLQTS